MQTRFHQIDVIRGLAILLVVLGHSIGYTSVALNKVILIFHMPLFFFLSGVLSKSGKNTNLGSLVIKKAKILLIPQITLGLITYIYDILVESLILNRISFNDINLVESIFGWWFLLVLFLCEILFYFVSKYIDFETLGRKVILIFGVFLIIIIVQYPLARGLNFPLYVNVLPMAFLFYLIGNFLNYIRYKESNNLDMMGSFIILIPVLILVAGINTPVTMFNNNYGNLILFIIGSFLGIYIVWTIGTYCRENLFLRFLGTNSIIIYVLQFKVIQAVRSLVSLVIGSKVDLYMRSFIIFLISVIILVPLTIVCAKYFGFAFGRKKENKAFKKIDYQIRMK